MSMFERARYRGWCTAALGLATLACHGVAPAPSERDGLEALGALAWVDMHVHLRSHERIADYVAWQDRFGMEAMALQVAPNLGGLTTGGRPNHNAEALLAKAEHPGRFYVFGGIDLSVALGPGGAAALEADLGAQVDLLAEAGADGLKLYFRVDLVEGLAARGVRWLPDAPALAPLWEAVRRHGLPALVHIDEPYFASGLATARAHPDLTFIVTHLAFAQARVERLEAVLAAGPRVFLDVGHYVHLGELVAAGEAARAFLTAHGDRVTQSTDFGSGCALAGLVDDDACPSEALAVDQVVTLRRMLETRERVTFGRVYGDRGELTVTGLGLDRAVLERLYRTTARALLGEPRPIGCPAAKAVVDRLLDRTTATDDRARLVAIGDRLAATCR